MASVVEPDTRCRLCGGKYFGNNQRVNIIEEKTMEIVEALLDIVEIDSERLGDSETVCSNCWQTITSFKEYVETCRKAQEQLLTEIFMEECPAPEDDDDRVDEVTSDHAYVQKLNQYESKLSTTDDDEDEATPVAGSERMERFVDRLLAEIDGKKHRIRYEATVFDCLDCSNIFDSGTELLEHRKTCVRIGNEGSDRYGHFSCTLCEFTSPSRAGFRSHLMRMHDSDKLLFRGAIQAENVTVTPDDKNYPPELAILKAKKSVICPVCSDQFTTLQKLRHHLLLHRAKSSGANQTSGDNSKRCEVCGKIFRSASLRRTHMKYHFNQKDVVCETCGKRFYSKTDLRDHHDAEHEDKRFVCNICGLHIKLRSNVKRHLRTHDHAQQFQCDRCPKRFSCRTNLRYHLDVHMGKKRHRCGSCGETFQYSYARNQHLYYTHGIMVAGLRLRKGRKRRTQTVASVRDNESTNPTDAGAVGHSTTISTPFDHDDLIEYDPLSPEQTHGK